MKRFCVLLLALLFCTAAFFSCANSEDEEQATPTPSAVVEEEEVPDGPVISLILNGETDFNKALAAAVKPIVEAGGFYLSSEFSENTDGQINDVYMAIGDGAQSIMILPHDMDNLQTALDDAYVQDIPIINLMIPLNAVVATLVSPDYKKMGAMAAKEVMDEMAAANVLTVEGKQSSFVTQLVHDGFYEAIAENEEVRLVSSILAEEADAQAQTAEALSANTDVNVVFVTDENLVEPVVRAVGEAESDIRVIGVGGGQGVLKLIQDGSLYGSVFCSPVQLGEVAGQFAIDAVAGTEIAQYAQLKLELITQGNIAQYTEQDGYATLLDPTLPEPEEPEEQEDTEPEDQADSAGEEPETTDDGAEQEPDEE